MANLGGTFDANNVTPSAPMELLPPGKYVVQIVQSEMKETTNGSGQYLKLEMEVMDGPSKGRKLWDNLNLVNPNPQTVDIAQRALSAICHAVGRLQVSDSEELHYKPMTATLAVEPDSRDKHLPPHEQRKQNRVKGYTAASGAAPAPVGFSRPAAASPAPAAAANTAAPPWRRAG